MCVCVYITYVCVYYLNMLQKKISKSHGDPNIRSQVLKHMVKGNWFKVCGFFLCHGKTELN